MNYPSLRQLFESYGKDGFRLVAFPCNQFGGQAPGTSEEERQRILAQIPDGPPTRHDLTPLRSPSAPHGSSGAGAV